MQVVLYLERYETVPKQRSNRIKYLLVAMILLVAVIIAAFALSQTSSKRPSANEYFVVTHTMSTGEFSNQNKTVTIATLGLNITAVGGDATDVYVRCSSQAVPEDDYVEKLNKGPPGWDIPVVLKGGAFYYRGLTLRLNDQGMFSVNVRVICNEVETASIAVLINPGDIANIPAIP